MIQKQTWGKLNASSKYVYFHKAAWNMSTNKIFLNAFIGNQFRLVEQKLLEQLYSIYSTYWPSHGKEIPPNIHQLPKKGTSQISQFHPLLSIPTANNLIKSLHLLCLWLPPQPHHRQCLIHNGFFKIWVWINEWINSECLILFMSKVLRYRTKTEKWVEVHGKSRKGVWGIWNGDGNVFMLYYF